MEGGGRKGARLDHVEKGFTKHTPESHIISRPKKLG